MKCERCNGLVIAVSFVGGGDDTHGAWKYDGLKCLNCGHITDPLFIKNRELTRSVAGPQPELYVPVIHHLTSIGPTQSQLSAAARSR
ncbi:MAG: hypothetical protein Nkreftii_003464 [Candidatus Nitrospira kreftii]|uniref:Uncharacterized protein n=1 Tax=Candidatus Nitrospira kreftii TaxID=2652173 RepID=A0A7S8FGT8_9BACT|nr:MAG: hypothetical protein Nkreftii_003464 [Candidatus Nitrospira kreftii]